MPQNSFRALSAVGDPFLERRQRDRYSPKTIQEHVGEMVVGYGEIESIAAKLTSPQEAKQRRRIMANEDLDHFPNCGGAVTQVKVRAFNEYRLTCAKGHVWDHADAV